SEARTIERDRPRASCVQRLPCVKRWYRQYLPLFPMAVEQFGLDRFDVIVSVSHCCVKSLVMPGHARHICYCLTPMRYAWDQFEAYFGADRIGALGSRAMRPAMARLARAAAATEHPVEFLGRVSNGLVTDYYRRAAVVLLPGEEDFGIVPVEAQACGRPVVALARGGPAETVIANETGLLVDEPTSGAF